MHSRHRHVALLAAGYGRAVVSIHRPATGGPPVSRLISPANTTALPIATPVARTAEKLS